ncbi:Ig-like domain-containing protein [Motiliproteus sp. SC1-56]|uniref:Ig-like domain-containing protein n=1 Tax=Motiliproteus sp. SC1-56 TaxID=2799565 RepID=UPI001A8F2683|nr:Ig-like domain-containing protein [Motiliproteus sp. SC1-56]
MAQRFPGAGISSALALNETGDAVGYVLIDGQFEAFIYTQENGVRLLPDLSALWPHHVAVDITERSNGQVIIAGDALGPESTDQLRDLGNPLIWVYDTASGTVTETVDVGLLPGGDAGRIYALNDAGVAVGYTRVLGAAPQPMVYDFANRSLNPLALSFIPVDINNNNVVAGSVRGDNNQALRATIQPNGAVLVVEGLGNPVDSQVFDVSAINSVQTVGSTLVFPFTDGAGRVIKGAGQAQLANEWLTHWSSSAFDVAWDLNTSGDLVGDLGIFNAVRGAIYIKSLNQTHLLEDLIDPPGPVVNSGRAINDAGWVAGGMATASLLRPKGDMPLPPAPTDLVAQPHGATGQEPWGGITVSWVDNSTLTQGYTLERRLSGADLWNVIIADWTSLSYSDLNVTAGSTYDYRVKAKGEAGFSAYSNIASATVPGGDNVDTQAPAVAFVEPAAGAQVLPGRVSVIAEAADNVGVTGMEIFYSGPGVNRTRLCSVQDAAQLNCTWNTRKLNLGVYTLEARAADASNNVGVQQIAVELVAKGGDGGGGGGGGGGTGGDGGASGEKGKRKCSDGIDNDGDGLIDGADPECQ